MKNKEVKFQLGDLLGIGLTLVVFGIGISYGLEVLGDIKDDQTTGSAEYNATGNAITGVAKLPAKLPLVCTVVIAAVIIGILIRYLAVSYIGRN